MRTRSPVDDVALEESWSEHHGATLGLHEQTQNTESDLTATDLN